VGEEVRVNIKEFVEWSEATASDWKLVFKNAVRQYILAHEDGLGMHGFKGTPFDFAIKLHKEFEKTGVVSQSDVTTPQYIAKQMLRVGGVEKGALVLDPCAGFGSLLHAAASMGAKVLGYETDPHYCLLASLLGDYHIRRENFLKYPRAGWRPMAPDVILLNPPVGSRKGDDATSVILCRIHELYKTADSTQIVAILPSGYFTRKAKKRKGSRVVRLFNVEDIIYMKRWQKATLRSREVAIYHLTCQV
jgi:predicted RNA methylase